MATENDAENRPTTMALHETADERALHESILEQLNRYEETHTAEDENIWEDVIYRLDDYDDGLTRAAFGDANDSTDFILIDGAHFYYDQPSHEWRLDDVRYVV